MTLNMAGERPRGDEAIDLAEPQFELHEGEFEHVSALRNYAEAPPHVRRFYLDNHSHHTYAFNHALWDAYASPLARTRTAWMWDVLNEVGELVDASDPDVDAPQIVHAFQSAEAARKAGRSRQVQAAVLVHDIGKILATDMLGEARPALPQWAVVGDTFPVGCRFDDRIVMSEFFHHQAPEPNSDDPLLQTGWPGNMDAEDERYNTETGIYHGGIGLDNVTMSFGHDEYLYQVLNGQCKLRPGVLKMIRYHSLYPIHKEGAYSWMLADSDSKTLTGVRLFNRYDLYSKPEEEPDIPALTGYYRELVDDYFPEPLRW